MAPESTQFTPIELGDRSRRQPNDPSQFNAVNHNAIPRNFPSSLPLLGKKVHNPGKTQTANIQDSTVEDKGRHQARILLLVASALYASELSFVAKLNESVPVGISLVLRFGLASISVLPLLFYDDGSAGRFLMARRGRFCWKTEKVGLDMGREDGTRINAVTASSECDDEDVISCNKSVTISVQSDVTPLIESRDDENVLPVSSSSNILRENQERLTDVDCRCLASSTSFKVTPLKKLFITGLEIGFYNGIGLTMNSLLLSGKIATASELAFVGSLSTVFVPLLEYAFIPFFDSIVRNCIVENNSKNVGDGTAIAKRMKWSQKCGIVMAIVGLGLLEGPFGSVEHGHGVPIGVTHLDAVILQRKSVWDQLGFNLAGSVTLKPSLHFGNFSIVPVSTIEHYPSEAKVTSINLIDRNSPKKSLSMEPSNHISHGPPTTQGYNNQRYSDDGSFLSTSVNNGGAILSVDGPQDSELVVNDVDNMKVESEGEKSLGESWRNNNDDEFSPDTSWDLNGDDAQPPFEDDLDASQDRGKTIGGNDANTFSSEEEEPLYPRNSLKDRGSSWGWSNLRKLICIAPPICFALGFYKIEQAMEKYPAAAKPITAAHIIGIFVITIICYFFSTITGVDILPVDNANSTDEFKKITFSQIASWLATPAILFQLLWSGIASIVIGIYLESLAMKTLTASESVVIFSTEPIFASAFASWFCGELFLGGSIIGALGAFSIVAGCIISELGCEFIGTGTKHLQSITACRRNYLGKLSRKKNDVVCNEDIGDNSSVNQMLSLPWNEEVTICMEMKQYSASNAVPVELNTPLFIGAGPTRLRRALKDALPDNADASDMEKRA